MMFSSLETYRKRIDRELEAAIERLGEGGRLRDACGYALLNGGKRLRPTLVYLIAETLGKLDVTQAALSVEYFHTASLIADDLPCMDNDDTRRNKPALHKAFDEGTALLASYTLVAAGYGAICEASRHLKAQGPKKEVDALTVLCLEKVTNRAGLRGATHGQFLDLFPPDGSFETIRTIIERKTATLFEIAFILGWLFGGGDPKRIEDVEKCAKHLGVAFQIADDDQDFLQDKKPRSINIAQALGREKARQYFDEEMKGLTRTLQSLGLWTRPFRILCDEMNRLMEAGPTSPARKILREPLKNSIPPDCGSFW